MIQHQARSWAEALLIQKASMTPIEAQALSDEQLAEHVVGVHGGAVLSRTMGDLAESIEARLGIGVAVPLWELEAILFAIFSSPYGTYYSARMLA
jgi:hypothetical protein